MDNEKQDNEENTTRKDDDFVDVPFEQLELNKWLIDQCKLLGYKKPTPIQYHCIPRILKGQDVIGCAKTGSGKTAAFALPIIQKLSEDPFGIYALVLTPTRLINDSRYNFIRAFYLILFILISKRVGLSNSRSV